MIDEMASGAAEALLSMTVIFETAFVLEAVYRMDRSRIARSIELVSGAPGIHFLDDAERYLPQTLMHYRQVSQLSFADCYHAVLALAHCNGEIYTFDKDFRRIPGITRLEPGASPESTEQPAPHPE
jgi:predicted nucleic acid-binding protein